MRVSLHQLNLAYEENAFRREQGRAPVVLLNHYPVEKASLDKVFTLKEALFDVVMFLGLPQNRI